MRFLPLVLAFAVVLGGCGGGGNNNNNDNTSTTVTITVSPTATTLTPNQSAQFTATVTNSTNTSVTWQVNGVAGGNSSVGLISTAGLYTSPATILVSSTVTITAVAAADTTKTATATVTLTPNSTAPSAPVLISPPSATLSAGAQQTFTAMVNGATANVTWSVSCSASSPGNCGSITQTGIYTAPLFPPPSGSVSVTATSTDNTGLPGNAPVIIKISNQSLFGSYAFSLSGSNAGTPVALAGSVTFDGQGTVSSGIEDVAGTSGPIFITGGTYHIGTDGRGSVSVETASGTSKWQIVMQNHSHILITGFDSGTNVISGTMDAQTPAQFNASAITGSYGFSIAGNSAAKPNGTLRGAGAFTADGTSAITSGLMDLNDTGTAQTSLALTGSFTPPSTEGRGTLTLTSSAGTQTFVYYMTDGTRLKLVESDSIAKGIAEAVTQATGPFSASSLKGAYATAISGLNSSSAPVSLGGILNLDGVAVVKATIDTNYNGNGTPGQSVTGTYAVTDATTGRTTFTWTANDGAHQYVFYPSSNKDLNVLEIDSMSASGPALQQSFVVSNSSYTGSFVVSGTGTDFTGTPGPQALSGLIIFNGGSAIAGVLDMNDNGTLTTSGAIKGSYSFDATGRATVNVTSGPTGFGSAQLNMYAADDKRAVYINTDSNRVATGLVLKQF